MGEREMECVNKRYHQKEREMKCVNKRYPKERERDGVKALFFLSITFSLGKKTTKIKSPNPWPASAIIASAEHGCSLLFFDFALVVAFLVVVVVVAEHEENCWRSASSAFRRPRSIAFDIWRLFFWRGVALFLGSLFLCHGAKKKIQEKRHSRQNFLLLPKIKNVVFLFVVFSFCKKVFVVLTFYSLREKCPNERSGNNNNNTS